MQLRSEEIEAMKNALLCFETYQEMVHTTRVIEKIGDRVHFELASESYSTPLASLTEGLK